MENTLLNDTNIFIDENEFKKFYDIIASPGIADYESFRLDLAVKHKYAKNLNLKKFKNTFIDQRSVNSYKNAIKYLNIFNTLKYSYTYTITNSETGDEEELVYPIQSYAVYMSCNPSNGIKVYTGFKEFYDNIINKSIFSENKNELHHFNKLNKIILSEAHKAENTTKNFIDIDMDIDKHDINQNNLLKELIEILDLNNVIYYIIESINGYHILMRRNTLKFNYIKLVDELNYKLMYDVLKHSSNKTYEIMINKAGFIPVPGTNRASFMVKLITKNDIYGG